MHSMKSDKYNLKHDRILVQNSATVAQSISLRQHLSPGERFLDGEQDGRLDFYFLDRQSCVVCRLEPIHGQCCHG